MNTTAVTDELALFRKLRQTGDPDLRDKLILKYQGLAEKIARRYLNSGEPIEDLTHEGYVGLIKAVDRFDPEKGVVFNTYATHTISGEIRHYLRDCGKLIHEPGWHQQLRYRILKTAEELEKMLGRPALPDEIAQAIGQDEETVRRVLATGNVFMLEPLESSENEEGDELELVAESLTMWDFVNGDREDSIVFREAIGKLQGRERKAVIGFFYDGQNKTEIARQMGISVNYVAYLIKRGLGNLKQILEKEEITAEAFV